VYTLNILAAAFQKELKQQAITANQWYMVAGSAATSAALAWIVYQSGRLETLAYLCIGVALISFWRGTVAISGWALSNELYGKTIDFTLISKAPLPVVLFGKILAQLVYEIPGGIISALSVLIVVRQMPQVVAPALLPFSIVLAVIGLLIMTSFLADMVILVGGKSGFFMGVVPFGAVLSGFILPVYRLPYGLEIIARFMPTSWAMDSVWQSIVGTDSLWPVIQNWGIAFVLALVWFLITVWLCNLVEKRIRVKGTIGAF
jgi:ABC-type multidrug transport system permease subunit